MTLFGDPCSDEILEQRKKDAELIDFFQNAPIAMHWLSGTGHVMWANQTELDVLGYTAEEYIGRNAARPARPARPARVACSSSCPHPGTDHPC